MSYGAGIGADGTEVLNGINLITVADFGNWNQQVPRSGLLPPMSALQPPPGVIVSPITAGVVGPPPTRDDCRPPAPSIALSPCLPSHTLRAGHESAGVTKSSRIRYATDDPASTSSSRMNKTAILKLGSAFNLCGSA